MANDPIPAFEFAGESSLKRLLALNRDRLRRVRDSLTARQREFLDALPLMFHLNHPLLPGYVSKDTAFGIAQYSPSQASVRAARQISRSFDYDRRTAPRFAIQALYLMGSPGTIAYSRTSDLDIWLIRAPHVSAEALQQLEKKAERIERFAATLALEVHFFIFDAERFRSGEDLSLSDESSGSSQHYLLLDEFYRSSLLVAGLPPLWWRVPARYDGDYENYVAAAEKRRIIDRADYIDFGALPTIPADEFFGAGVWQLYKGIGSPYKSVLKLLLMEAYAGEYPHITLLCTRFKRNVESEQVDLNAVDPYILMYCKVEEYLSAKDDRVRLDVVRRSFYIKANVAVNANSRAKDDWRVEVMAAFTNAWGWSDAQISRLNDRENWGLEVAVEERRDLTNTFKLSYTMLSRFAQNHASESKITKDDLQVLGRKLYAAFERKPSKIEIITTGICADPVELSLSLHEVKISGNKHIWTLFRGSVTPAEAGFRQPIKRSDSAAEIVLWCQLNRIASQSTTWHLFTGDSPLTTMDIKRIEQTLGHALLAESRNGAADAADNRRRISRIALLVNVGVNPFAKPLGGGDVLTSDRNDPFAYGGREINLVHTIDLMFMTSWNEAFAFHYEGPRAVLEAAAECLQWLAADRDKVEMPTIETSCVHLESGALISERVGELFTSTLNDMAQKWRVKTPHIIMQCENELHHLRMLRGVPVLESYSSQSLLLQALGRGDDEAEQSVRFDRSCSRTGLLAQIYRHNRAGTIQVIAHQRGPRADIYLLEERGYLITHRQECPAMASLLGHYRSFLESALERCEQSEFTGSKLAIETLEAIGDGQNIQFKPYFAQQGDPSKYLPLHVLADADSSGHRQFTIYVGDREFSTWEHGGSLFVQVAEYVLAQRANGTAYPIYITDLDLSTRFRQTIGVSALRPFDLIGYKKRIEHQLTRAMHNNTSVTAVVTDLAS